MSITYGTADFVAATKGATFDSHPQGENSFTLTLVCDEKTER